jgi:MtN3 and saliva related transmembrane protein
MIVTVLGVSAAFWGLLMALSPLLQIRQMWLRQSSEDVSVGFFAVLLPGFALWIAYGLARADLALIVPNVVAILVGTTTITVAMLLRRRARANPRHP